MSKRTGGTNVRSGFYWNLRSWKLVAMPREGGILPGGAGDRYLKIPVVAMLLLAPLMGGLYVIFLPFIGIAMVVAYLARTGRMAAQTGFMELAVMVSPHWAPGEAYLAGKRARKAKAQAKDKDTTK